MFRRCKHENVRCIHGDEIWSTIRAWRIPSIARVRCQDCNKPLYGWELPALCWNGQPHFPLNAEEPTALAYTPDDELLSGVEEFKNLWPEKWEAWIEWCQNENSPVEAPVFRKRVHNHRPYHPVCNERVVSGQLRGACLNDDGSDREA